MQVAHISAPCVVTGPVGDTDTFATANSKLSDADINALGFDVVKFEPVDPTGRVTRVVAAAKRLYPIEASPLSR